MAKQEFKAESKRLLELMIHSVYTHKEIFLRELISNASDALDKRHYIALTDDRIAFDRDDFYIRIEIDKEKRTLTLRDTGIGMTGDELESNLGTIARSGSLDFRMGIEQRDDIDIIGQFGIGFYSAFMVADSVTVRSRSLLGEDEGWEWRSEGADGYTMTSAPIVDIGTTVILALKANSEDERYDDFLEPYHLKALVRKYSDFIKYPIIMETVRSVPKEDSPDAYEEVVEDEILNSMIPIWRKNKNELTAEDYNSFYTDRRFGFDPPLRHIHITVEGAVSYTAILYIPARVPYDFYSQEFEKGLTLYSNGVMILQKCSDLLPDFFAFVQGMVDSDDLSLNISRELLQHDRQLKLIARQIERDVKSELVKLMEDDRESYEAFFAAFGRQLKYGVYADWGAHKENLQDLLLFYSSTEKKLTSLKEYTVRMREDQSVIYYAAGGSVEKLSRLPQTERLIDSGYEILYLTDDIDEFAIRMLEAYEEKSFKNISEGSLELEDESDFEETEEHRTVFSAVREELGELVSDVRASKRLRSHPVCLVTEGEISIEMERVLATMPDNRGIKADRVLEINTGHQVFAALSAAYANKGDSGRFAAMARILYNQALLIEGLAIDDPTSFAEDIWLVAT